MCTVLGIVSALTVGSVNDAYAVDFVLSDATSCTGLPGGGESWNATSSTCSKTSNLSITATNTLTVTNGVTLELSTNRELINRGNITNFGTITLEGTTGSNGQLRNLNNANFTNSGIITLDGTSGSSGRLRNQNTAEFTNSGTITITGASGNSGWLQNRHTAEFTNSGTITITGTSGNSAQFRNQNTADFTNSGTITVSGLVRNLSTFTNLGSFSASDGFNNNNANSVITNSGTIQVTLNLNNAGGLITNNCGQITFGTISGNSIQEITCQTIASSSSAYEDPTIGKSRDGRQVVENGICIDFTCWTVTADFHQEFELVEMLSDSVHTIDTTVFCQSGVVRCNYVAFGVSPYGTNINDSVWKIILQKDHLDNWTMKVIDDGEYLGEVTSTTQIVNGGKHLSASATIEFKKPTPGMILNIEVRDSKGGYRDFKFNDGIAIVDSYAYPLIESHYEPSLIIEPLCLNENPNKRYTCAFEKIREQTLIDATTAYEEIMNKK